jgi:5'-phosphate synthase pdxT subunit
MTDLTAQNGNSAVVGVLALQGDFAEHAAALRRIGTEPLEVRTPAQLQQIDGLIIPGGESTTIARLLIAYELREPIIAMGRAGFPIWGTCAGAILMAEEIVTLDRPGLHLLPMTVERNAYGRQIDSFEADLDPGVLGGETLRGVFIRAPRIRSLRPGVEVLLRLGPDAADEAVAVRYGMLMASTFHPELTQDGRLHRCFVEMCEQYLETRDTQPVRQGSLAGGGVG